MPRRVLATWLIQALVLLVLGWLLPGVEVDDPLAALLGSAVIAGLNALVRPIIVVLTLPLTVATFGLLSLIINTSNGRARGAVGARARRGWLPAGLGAGAHPHGRHDDRERGPRHRGGRDVLRGAGAPHPDRGGARRRASGLVQFGIVSAVVAVVVFYYLTRPHVAAVFRRTG